jgi:hypothetical protein
MFDCSALQARGPDDWSFLDDRLSPARAERDGGRPMIGAFISMRGQASGTRSQVAAPRRQPSRPCLGLTAVTRA